MAFFTTAEAACDYYGDVTVDELKDAGLLGGRVSMKLYDSLNSYLLASNEESGTGVWERDTVYDSALDNYTDSGSIAAWAKEAMAFMNALGFIKGTSDTTLSPASTCTVEQALIVAYRSLDADEIGWYQCVAGDESNLAGVTGGTTYNNFDTIPGGGSFSLRTYSRGERFWRVRAVTPANLMETKGEYDRKAAMAVIDKYTGQMLWVGTEDFKPIKELP